MRKLAYLVLLTALLSTAGIAEAAWQQRAAFFPDRLTSHSWETTTIALPGCDSNSVILQKAKSPGTVVQLLFNPGANATCQAAINQYVDQMIQRNPDASGSVNFIR